MLAAERRLLIAERVRARGVVSIAEISELLRTSEITVRRDLRNLADQGLVMRTHGGARSLRVSKIFISGNGLTAERGLSTPNPQMAASDGALAAAAERVIVLADHTKVGIETMCQTVPLERMATLITDQEADPGELNAIRAAGVEVLVAEPLASKSLAEAANA
jgi:DeoR/GlpR family transcriptional regulator of sugar metabolism